jgi:hypothetical protein
MSLSGTISQCRSRAGAREEIKSASVGPFPDCHSREGGNPVFKVASYKDQWPSLKVYWVPACAGTTLDRNAS